MIARAGSGWQTLLADLSLILFMVTASALSQSREGKPGVAPQPSQRTEPLAVWRNGEGMPRLADWLASQSVDGRQQLSVVVHYVPGADNAAQQAALAEATHLIGAAGAGARTARLVVEPGVPGAAATLAYDSASLGLARGLHRAEQTPQSTEATP